MGKKQIAGAAKVLDLLGETDDLSQNWINQIVEALSQLGVWEYQLQASHILLVDSWLSSIGILRPNGLHRVWLLQPEIKSILIEPRTV